MEDNCTGYELACRFYGLVPGKKIRAGSKEGDEGWFMGMRKMTTVFSRFLLASHPSLSSSEEVPPKEVEVRSPGLRACIHTYPLTPLTCSDISLTINQDWSHVRLSKPDFTEKERTPHLVPVVPNLNPRLQMNTRRSSVRRKKKQRGQNVEEKP